jgi:hypothetical protein
MKGYNFEQAKGVKSVSSAGAGAHANGPAGDASHMQMEGHYGKRSKKMYPQGGYTVEGAGFGEPSKVMELFKRP